MSTHIQFIVNNNVLILQSLYTCMVYGIHQPIAYGDVTSIVVDRQEEGRGPQLRENAFHPHNLPHVFLVWS